MKFLFLATFKSNKLTSEVKDWVSAVSPSLVNTSAHVAIAPAFPHLHLVTPPLTLAAQNVSPFPAGSYTGEVSASQLADMGVEYCIIGHSERRTHLEESYAQIAAKARELVENGITPVICLSKDDLSPQLSALDDSLIKKPPFVYEPPADIGGTETAALSDIQETCDLIRTLSSGRPTLYGGSVNAGNLEGLLELNLDGVLVSSAALSSSTFINLLNRYDALRG